MGNQKITIELSQWQVQQLAHGISYKIIVDSVEVHLLVVPMGE